MIGLIWTHCVIIAYESVMSRWQGKVRGCCNHGIAECASPTGQRPTEYVAAVSADADSSANMSAMAAAELEPSTAP